MKAEIRNLTNEEYHACEGLSASAIKLLLECPRNYHHQYIYGDKPESTPAMRFGTALHTMVFEPEKFDSLFYTVLSMPQKGSKNHLIAIEAAAGRDLIHIDDVEDLKRMTDLIWQDEVCPSLISKEFGSAEQSIFWEDEETGILLKSRPDFINNSLKTIPDLKSSSDASEIGFQRSKLDYRYDIQAVMQQIAVKKLTGEKYDISHIVIEKKSPFNIEIYEMSETELDMGLSDLRRALSYYKDCMALGKWRGYTPHDEWIDRDSTGKIINGSKKIIKLGMMGWAENKFLNEGTING